MVDEKKNYSGDEIYEAIKREDFLRMVRSVIPFLILGAIVILASTIAYVWWQYREERKSYDAEQSYLLLLSDIQAERFSDAKKRCQEDLLKNHPGFSQLALLQMAHLFQKDIQNTGSQLSWTQLKDIYSKILNRKMSVPLECLFASGQGLLNPAGLSAALQSKDKAFQDIQKFFSPGHSWYDMGLLLQALAAYATKDHATIQAGFSQWEKEASASVRWVPAYCSIGQGLPRVFSEKNIPSSSGAH